MHPNIVPLLGVTITPPQFVSGWMPGGNLRYYVKMRHGLVNEIGLVGDPSVASGGTLTPFSSYLMSSEASSTSTPTI